MWVTLLSSPLQGFADFSFRNAFSSHFQIHKNPLKRLKRQLILKHIDKPLRRFLRMNTFKIVIIDGLI